MNVSRSPVDRLRAIRAGRVSQLLDQTPSDGLPPTQPAKVTLNGKKVEMGAAFESQMATRHALNLLQSPQLATNRDRQKYTKAFNPRPPNPSNLRAAQAVAEAFGDPKNLALAASSILVSGTLPEMMALQRDSERNRIAYNADRDEPLSLFEYLFGTGEESKNESTIDELPGQLPPIVRPPNIPSSLPGQDPDDPALNRPIENAPYPADPPQLPDNLPPDDPEEFNRPQIETIPMEPISWEDLVNYANSHPNTKEDDEDVLQAFKKAMEERGIQVVSVADIGIREKEFYLPNVIENVRQRLGSRYADIAIPFKGPDGTIYIGIINTVDTRVDHETPDARERRAAESINSLRQFIARPVSDIALIPKSRDVDRQQWRDQLDIRAREVVDRWLEWAAGQ
jgi:hypothetical protein